MSYGTFFACSTIAARCTQGQVLKLQSMNLDGIDSSICWSFVFRLRNGDAGTTGRVFQRAAKTEPLPAGFRIVAFFIESRYTGRRNLRPARHVQGAAAVVDDESSDRDSRSAWERA